MMMNIAVIFAAKGKKIDAFLFLNIKRFIEEKITKVRNKVSKILMISSFLVNSSALNLCLYNIRLGLCQPIRYLKVTLIFK